ncbi:MAG TPA: M56 family metallopeptidase [Candidatus Solibacter sp.]|nr:M56 family metallopeptidase [Candidatus Solibacter sp.]
MTIVNVVESSYVLTLLVGSALRAILLAGATALLLAAFRVKPAAARLFAWKGALYAGLAMPLLGLLLPPVGIPAPKFLQQSGNEVVSAVSVARPAVANVAIVSPDPHSRTADASVAVPSETRRRAETSSATSLDATTRDVSSTPLPPSVRHASPSRAIPWGVVAIGFYLGVVALLLVRFAIGVVFGSRLVRRSREINDSLVSARLKPHASFAGLALAPQIAETELISVPLTIGVTRPTILLPESWRDWNEAKLNAVLAHEISHVARRDTLTQRLSLLHRAVFWFSPLAWWLPRHLSDLAEQASDDAALLCGADRNDYARTLLGFFEALHSAPGRVWWQGVAMAKAGQAEQRLERILAWRGAVTMGLKKSLIVAIVALAIPVVYLAASITPVSRTHDSLDISQEPAPAAEQTEASPAIPSAAPTAAPTTAPVAPRAITGVIAGVPAPPAARVQAMVPPVPPAEVARQEAVRHSYSHGYGYSYSGGSGRGRNYDDDDDDLRYVIVSGNSDSVTMSGSSGDARHAQRLKKQISGDFIWFQRDEKSYIIRDQALVQQAKALWAPQEELGRKQEELGKQQEALGKQQEELSAKMEKVRVQVPDMTAELDKLRAELKQLSAGATMDQVGELQSEIGELQSKIGEIQSHAGDQQSKIGEEMGALGEKQGKLGEQQGKLGEQQGELAEKAGREMRKLLDDAIKSGKAQPEPDGGSASL